MHVTTYVCVCVFVSTVFKVVASCFRGALAMHETTKHSNVQAVESQPYIVVVRVRECVVIVADDSDFRVRL